jgi:hypothetical protein
MIRKSGNRFSPGYKRRRLPGDPWLAKAAGKLVIEIDNEAANLL